MIEYLVDHATILGLMVLYLVFCLSVGWYFRSRAAAGVTESLSSSSRDR